MMARVGGARPLTHTKGASMTRFLTTHKLLAMTIVSTIVSQSWGQTWDLPSVTQLISGAPYDTTGTAGLVVSQGHLWYCDYDGAGSPLASDRGTVTVLYRAPVVWHSDEEAVFFENAVSPTGDSVHVTLSIDAVVYQLNGPTYQGMVVGLLDTYAASSAGDSSEFVMLEPGAITADGKEAKAMFKTLANADIADPNVGGGGDPSCIQQCKNTYETEKKNARDRFLTNVKATCGVLGIPGGFIGGCTIGTAICGWAAPPFSTLFCCLAGGIIGSGATFGGCTYAQHELMLSDMRAAERNYKNCLRNCGVEILEW